MSLERIGLEPGDAIGHFRLERQLGEGAMGVVFLAAREPEGEAVALKVLRQALAADEVYRDRFRREARVAADVQHPGLVRVVESGEADGFHYLAVELVEGGTLEDLLERERWLALADTVQIASDIAGGLEALHAAGIVHRDVKPSNVMLRTSGRAALTDFGLAKGRAYTVLTRPGQVMGTLDYIAPELIRGEEATPASDVYALGCLTYECVTGVAPFASKAMFEVAVAHLEEEPPSPAAARPDLPADLGWVIMQALAKKPEERPPTPRAFATMLGVAVPGR